MDARETTIYNAVLIGAMIIGGLLLFLLGSIVRLHRRQLRADRQHASTELRLIETERARIAADLHDELGPVLSAAKFRISAVKDPGEKNEQLLSDAIGHIDSIVVRIREIANGLLPSVLPDRGIVFAVQEFIRGMPAVEGRLVRFEYGVLPSIPPAAWVHVYRIMQEMIYNAVRHANAHEIVADMRTSRNELLLTCVDDGNGFVVPSPPGKGQGLRNILVRAEMMGGKMYIQSGKGKGTQIRCVLPLENNSV